MALSFLDNVDYRGKKPNFARDLFDTIADMKNYSELYLPDVFVACCKETGKLYIFNRNNELDTDLGKWREFDTGSSSGDVSEAIVFTTKVGNIPPGTTFPAGTPVDVILASMGGTTTTESYTLYYGVVDDPSALSLDALMETQTSGSASVEITSNGQYVVFVSEQELSDIRDELGFPNGSEFTKTTQQFDGSVYNVYISNYPITCENFNYILTV